MENAPRTGSIVSEGAAPAVRVTVRQSASSAVLSLGLMVGAGVALGFLSHLIGLSHPKGVIFKILIALPLSLVGAVLLHRFAFARKHVLVLAGLGAVAAMLSLHYFDYRDFPRTLDPRLRDVLEAQVIRQRLGDIKEQARAIEEKAVKSPPEEQKKREQALHKIAEREERLEADARKLADPEKEREMEPVFRRFEEELSAVRARIKAQGEQMALGQPNQGLEPVVAPWIRNLGLWGYLDLRADQGATLDVFVGKVHLGYAASYVYWIAEVVIAGLIAGGIMHKFATDKELEKAFKNLLSRSARVS